MKPKNSNNISQHLTKMCFLDYLHEKLYLLFSLSKNLNWVMLFVGRMDEHRRKKTLFLIHEILISLTGILPDIA